MLKKILSTLLFLCFYTCYSQPIALYKQFAGSYDFTMIGNTLNTAENNTNPTCVIQTQSAANLNLNANQTVVAAYLYWSGSATPTELDINIQLNNIPITAQRIFTGNNPNFNRTWTGAFADVTNLVQTTGNGIYTFSDFDINSTISFYCPGSLNYGGWAIIVIYEDPLITNRMVNIYDGLQVLHPIFPIKESMFITLNKLNLTNNNDSKLGFLVWEGDEDTAVSEELLINNNLVSNPPLNPVNNIFNGTNSFTGLNTLYNMDLDYFNISNFITTGDTALNIEMSSGRDIILANAFALTLINQLPDATLAINNVITTCDSQDIKVNYTVFNTNASEILPANTPIAFYANNILVGTTTTKSTIAIKDSQTANITLNIPTTIATNFTLKAVVDDDSTGIGIVNEIDETNNTDTKNVVLKFSPEINTPNDITICDENGNGFIYFDLDAKKNEISTSANVNIRFYLNQSDAENGINSLTNTTNYELASHSTQTIWVRVEDTINQCAALTFFNITAQMKPFTGLNEPLMLCNLKDNQNAVNLTNVHMLLSKMYSYLNEIEFKFYETETNAINEVNEITNTTNYQPGTFPQIIYIKAKGKNNLWCDTILQLQLNNCVIPKGISPNGDGMNDGFDIAIFNPLALKIYNRYGTEVYSYNLGYTNQWNGQDKNNKILPTGTYFYSFKTMFDTYIGYVYIVREVK